MTGWSDWSACSQTCVVSDKGPTVGYGGYNREGSREEQNAWNMLLFPPEPPKILPRRDRYRSVG